MTDFEEGLEELPEARPRKALKILVPLIILIVIIGIVLVFIRKPVEEELPTTPIIEEEAEELLGIKEKVDVLFLSCLQIQNEAEKNNCFLELALNKENMSYCYQINDSTIRDNCVRDITQIAIAKEDTSFCFIGFECYSDVAIALNDASLCEKIPTNNTPVIEYCYYKYVEAKGDTKVCQKIKNVTGLYEGCINLTKT